MHEDENKTLDEHKTSVWAAIETALSEERAKHVMKQRSLEDSGYDRASFDAPITVVKSVSRFRRSKTPLALHEQTAAHSSSGVKVNPQIVHVRVLENDDSDDGGCIWDPKV